MSLLAAGGHLVEYQLFSYPAAHHHGQHVLELVFLVHR